jgi:hypothetical protein
LGPYEMCTIATFYKPRDPFFAGYPIDYLLNLYLGLSSTSEAGQVMDSWCNRLATVTRDLYNKCG